MFLSLFVVLLLLVSACSKEESSNTASDKTDTTTEEPAETSDETEEPADTEESTEPTLATSGEETFKQSCITCHSSGDITGGQSKLDAARIQNKFKAESELHGFVSSNMPKNAPGSLSAEEYESVVKYLWEQKN